LNEFVPAVAVRLCREKTVDARPHRRQDLCVYPKRPYHVLVDYRFHRKNHLARGIEQDVLIEIERVLRGHYDAETEFPTLLDNLFDLLLDFADFEEEGAFVNNNIMAYFLRYCRF